jgi:glutaredoxin
MAIYFIALNLYIFVRFLRVFWIFVKFRTCAIDINGLYILTSLQNTQIYRMLTKSPLLQSITSISMVIGSVATSLTLAQANPSIPNNVQENTVVSQLAPDNDSKPRRYGRTIALGAKVETVSGAAEIAFAEHLAAKNITFYGAYWCTHCQSQKSYFGAAAAAKLPYVECAKDGANSQRELCRTKNIQVFPTWVIDGKNVPGAKKLKELAAITGYKGPMNFTTQP